MVAVASGGNIDLTCLGRVLERGMAADGRLTQFSLTISDRPGGAADLTKILSEIGARCALNNVLVADQFRAYRTPVQ